VVLLEARDRIGGRVWSRATPRRVTPAELGAEFIHGKAPQTMALLREAGMAAIDIADESWTSSQGCELERDLDDFHSAAAIFTRVRELAADESVDRFLRRFGDDETTRASARVAREFVEGFDAADPAIASALGIAQEWQSGVDWTSARPLAGYPPLFELLRGACIASGVDLRLSTVVSRIVWRRGHVAVDAAGPSGEPHTIGARAAIVTLPAGVLRHAAKPGAVAFDPELPRSKADALQHIEMGHVVKVTLLFRSPFWERISAGRYRNGAFFRRDGQSFRTYWTQLPVRSELIVAWSGGPPAAALGPATHDERVERALRGLAEIFGEPQLARDEFEAGFTHDWTTDPFARGAYSYVRVGGANARAVLAEPVESTLFFAGEATSTDGQGGTVNGALESGERAAREAASSG
jgi:monoamine oxidase